MLVANVTGLAAAWCDLVALHWDVAVLQEVRIGPTHRVMSSAREAKIEVILGPLASEGVALVAFLIPEGHPTPIAAVQHCRCAALLWQYRGCAPVRLYSLYGDASDSLVGSLETGELARTALADAESAGAVPSMLCGDFNLTFAQLPCLHALVASNWSDLGGGPLVRPPMGSPAGLIC